MMTPFENNQKNEIAKFFESPFEPSESEKRVAYVEHLIDIFNSLAREEQKMQGNFLEQLEDLAESLTTQNDNPNYESTISLLSVGDFDIRRKIRPLTLCDSVLNQNRRESLNLITDALGGDIASRESYEARKLIIPEHMPEWLKSTWYDQSRNSWRSLSTDSREFNSNLKRLGAMLEPGTVKTFTVPHLRDCSDQHDLRWAFYFYSGANKFLDIIDQEMQRPSQHKKDNVLNHIEHAVTSDFVNYFNVSFIGSFNREIVRKEYNRLLVAHIINDGLQALNLNISDARKIELWESSYHAPWAVASHRLFTDGPKIQSILETSSRSTEEIQSDLERITFNKKDFKEFHRNQHTKGEEQAEITNESIALHSIELPPIAPPIRAREQIAIALIENFGPSQNHEATARKLAKLIGNSDNLLLQVVNKIERKVIPAVILDELRGKSALDNELISEAKLESPAEPKKEELESSSTEEHLSRTKRLKVIFSKDAQSALEDDTIRKAVMTGIEKMIDHPHSADKRRIWACQEVWELRLVGQALRVYFFFPGDNSIAVLKIGKKRDQDRDVPKLNALKNRMKSSIEAADK